MYQLYYNPYSQHSRRVVALLVEAGLEHELKRVALDKGEQRQPAFLALNPNHQVPVLIDDDFTLTESNAILRYLANEHQLQQWYPVNPQLRARVDQWLDWNQTQLGPATGDVVFNKIFLAERGDQAAIARGQSRLVELGPILDGALSSTSFLTGTRPSLADLSVGSNITQLHLADAVPAGEHIRAWYERLLALPGFRAALPHPPGD